jgi:CheY-like chemotaxis protein
VSSLNHATGRSRLRSPIDVVVADDDLADNLMLTTAAQDARADLRFTFVEDGFSLLSVLSERIAAGQDPDLVVLDMRMPRCSGLEAMEKIRDTPSLAHIPVVMFTTSRREADIRRAQELGVAEYAIKPSTYAELVEFTDRLNRLVTRRSLRAPGHGVSPDDPT